MKNQEDRKPKDWEKGGKNAKENTTPKNSRDYVQEGEDSTKQEGNRSDNSKKKAG